MGRDTKGQVTVETAVLFSFVVAGLIFMGFYLQRAAQGGVKSNAEGIGTQFSTQSAWKTFSQRKGHETTHQSTDASCAEYQHSVGEDANQDGLPDNAPAVGTPDCNPAAVAGWADPAPDIN